jgi:undecaprenyl-diphosphatase
MSAHAPSPRAKRIETRALLLLGLAAAGLVTFLLIGNYVRGGVVHALDERLLLALRTPADHSDPLGPRWLEEAVRDVTALGSATVLAILTLAVAGFLAAVGKRHTALLLLGSVAGGVLFSTLLKGLYHRPRPDLVAHGTYVATASFPSGHAALSAVTYLTLGALLARVQSRRHVRAYVLAAAVLLTLLVGASRVYLGVHWPSDVAGGWALGCGWSVGAWFLTRRLQREGEIEPEPKTKPDG